MTLSDPVLPAACGGVFADPSVRSWRANLPTFSLDVCLLLARGASLPARTPGLPLPLPLGIALMNQGQWPELLLALLLPLSSQRLVLPALLLRASVVLPVLLGPLLAFELPSLKDNAWLLTDPLPSRSGTSP